MFERRQSVLSEGDPVFESFLAGDRDEVEIRLRYPPQEWPVRRAIKLLERSNRLAKDRLHALRATARTMAEVEQGLCDLLKTYPGYLPVLKRVLASLGD